MATAIEQAVPPLEAGDKLTRQEFFRRWELHLEDRLYKGALYAQEKIAEFWLINVVERKVAVYARPRAGTCQKKIEFTARQSVPLVLDGVKIADLSVSELIAGT